MSYGAEKWLVAAAFEKTIASGRRNRFGSNALAKKVIALGYIDRQHGWWAQAA
jgi:hypothetical protein